MFQSLIWVACPTGLVFFCYSIIQVGFQSLIWVACPTGPTGPQGGRFAAARRAVSIPHMGCMPYGLELER